LRLSPDGTRAAVVRNEFLQGFDQDLWIVDVARGTQARITFGPGRSRSPVWSPDGTRVAYTTELGEDKSLSVRQANGAGNVQVLLQSKDGVVPTSWSADGRFLLYTLTQANTSLDLWALPLDGDRKPFPLVQTPRAEYEGQLSPDGRWVAYVSEEADRNDVTVRPFSPGAGGSAATDARWVVGAAVGGTGPRWLAGGKQLAFVAAGSDPSGRRVMVVDVLKGPAFQWGTARALAGVPMGALFIDLTADGKRLLAGIGTEATLTSPPLNVVMNWFTGLER
jgi:Tol biopolymer transport system component